MISKPLLGDKIGRATGIEQCPRNDEVEILFIYGFTGHLEDSDAILFGLDLEKSASRRHPEERWTKHSFTFRPRRKILRIIPTALLFSATRLRHCRPVP